MKNRKEIWLNVTCFFIGVLVCYIATQIKFLELDLKVNVTESIIGLLTAAIGLYIATTLQKAQSRNEKLSDYLHLKVDEIWTLFSSLEAQLQQGTTIQLTIVTKTTKDILYGLGKLKRVYLSFGVSQDLLDALEIAVDNLESLLTTQTTVSANVINFSSIRATVENSSANVTLCFAAALKQVNMIN